MINESQICSMCHGRKVIRPFGRAPMPCSLCQATGRTMKVAYVNDSFQEAPENKPEIIIKKKRGKLSSKKKKKGK